MTALIDTTEMYLRTVLELEEDGVRPLRARLVERLGLSGPTVSETVAKLEHEGLMRVGPDRGLELSATGRRLANEVMRKHRLAELLLTDVIGLDWVQAHREACRWEHVISDEVGDRLDALLAHPGRSPYGNPIPGSPAPDDGQPEVTLARAAAGPAAAVTVSRISERVQSDVAALDRLRGAGVVPGAVLRVTRAESGVQVGAATLSAEIADGVFVRP